MRKQYTIALLLTLAFGFAVLLKEVLTKEINCYREQVVEVKGKKYSVNYCKLKPNSDCFQITEDTLFCARPLWKSM